MKKICNNDSNNLYDLIKSLFIREKKILIILLILIISIIIFYYFYIIGNYKINHTRNFSLQYENILESINNKPQALIEAEKFAANSKNIYSALISLKIAQQYVIKDELEQAVLYLKNGLSKVNDNKLKKIINLRLVRILLQQKKIDEALKILDSLNKKMGGFASIISDIRGDILLIKGDKQRAYDSWEESIKDNISPNLGKFIQMKINNLSL